ncbi:MAG: hypothetical protein ACI4K7_08075 [Oscillospiraceae bacterium]
MNIRTVKKVSAALTAAAVGLSLTGCTNYKKLMEEEPGKYVAIAAKNTAKALIKPDELGIAAQAASALESGAAYITVDTKDMDYSAYFSGSDSTEYQLGGLSMSSDKGTLDMRFSADKQKLYAAVTGPTANYAYFVDMDTFSDKLDYSIFRAGSGSDYALDEDTIKSIKEAVESIKAEINKTETEDSADNGKYDDYIDRIGVTSVTADISVDGEDVKADVITYSIDSALFDDIMADFYKESYSDYFTEEEWTEYEQQLRDSLDAEISLDFNINSKTHMLMSMTLRGSFTSDDETAEIDGGLVFGAKPDKADKLSVYLNLSENGDPESFSADFFKGATTDGTTVWNSVFSLTENDEVKTAHSSLTYVKDTGALSLVFTNVDDEAVTINGSVTSDSTGAMISLDSITSSNGEDLMAGTTVSLKLAKDPIPAITADKDFLDITEEELNSMGESIGNDFGTVFGLDY